MRSVSGTQMFSVGRCRGIFSMRTSCDDTLFVREECCCYVTRQLAFACSSALSALLTGGDLVKKNSIFFQTLHWLVRSRLSVKVFT